MTDLINRIASAEGADTDGDAFAWFRDRFGEEPSYSVLLDQLCGTSADRRGLLEPYFTASVEERQEGLKVPQLAHSAIAELVVRDYVRVIITTNFDHLIEDALRATGIIPTIISTPEAAEGAVPLAHSQCSIIKVHGDFLDTRMKNTPSELESYEAPLERLLGQVVDEYGLVVCGWSGTWDKALGRVLTSCPTRRFGTYWTVHGSVSEHAERLIAVRGATKIPIEGADNFFRRLCDDVLALEESTRPHPVSIEVAVAKLKKFLVDDSKRIQLRDLAQGEATTLLTGIEDRAFSYDSDATKEEFRARLRTYEGVSERMVALLACGSYWGQESQLKLWSEVLQRLAIIDTRGGSSILLGLRRYPLLLCVYGAGISSVAAGRPETAIDVMVNTVIDDHRTSPGSSPLAQQFTKWSVFGDSAAAKWLPTRTSGVRFAVSQYLFEWLREPLRQLVPSDALYEQSFDHFEYYWGILGAGYDYDEADPLARGPIGRRTSSLGGLEVDFLKPLLNKGPFAGKTFEELSLIRIAFDRWAVKVWGSWL